MPTQEERRRDLASNSRLYPDLATLGPTRVQSGGKSSVPETVLISSDTDDDSDESDGSEPAPIRKKPEAPLQPSSRNVNSGWNLAPQTGHPSTEIRKNLIPIPTTQAPRMNAYTPPADGGETLHIPEQPEDYRWMSPKDTDDALRNLIQGAMNDDDEAEVNMAEAVVKGFREGILLMPHQVIGRRWMKERENVSKKRFGGILADDMGLGKTIQTLTRILDGKPRLDEKDEWGATTLVVCPLALVGQWADEAKKIAPGLTVVKHHGTTRASDTSAFKRAHIVITTYDVVKSEYGIHVPAAKKPKKVTEKSPVGSDSEYSDDEPKSRVKGKRTGKKKDALFQMKWWRIVLDEAHNIKNRKTIGAVACCALEGRFRWCLTGTPMQNEVSELYSLINFLHIKPYSNWERFNEQIAKPVKNGRGANGAMKKLHVVLSSVLLRRRKDQLLNGKVLIELPKRNIEIVSCYFNASEQQFYTSLEMKMDSVLQKLMRSDKKSTYMSVLLLLLRLRQACNHPVLVDNEYTHDLEAVEPVDADGNLNDADMLAAAMGNLNVVRKCKVCTMELSSRNTHESDDNTCIDCTSLITKAPGVSGSRTDSAKIRMILELLATIDERSQSEDKTIIFSQFTSMLDLIEPFLRAERIKYVRYDGSMQPLKREESLHAIRTDKDIRVILISFKAGSTGLNLTACNNVILVDMWWNPALEDQAFDRAHRMGQTKDVYIYKLKVDNTVEERILELQEKKRELARAALSGDKMKAMKRLGMEELLGLFNRYHDNDDED